MQLDLVEYLWHKVESYKGMGESTVKQANPGTLRSYKTNHGVSSSWEGAEQQLVPVSQRQGVVPVQVPSSLQQVKGWALLPAITATPPLFPFHSIFHLHHSSSTPCVQTASTTQCLLHLHSLFPSNWHRMTSVHSKLAANYRASCRVRFRLCTNESGT